MTSQGDPYTRLRRVLETRSSALLIRAAAAELPSVPLEDALDICLALLELEPGSYPRIATRWGSRLAIERIGYPLPSTWGRSVAACRRACRARAWTTHGPSRSS